MDVSFLAGGVWDNKWERLHSFLWRMTIKSPLFHVKEIGFKIGEHQALSV